MDFFIEELNHERKNKFIVTQFLCGLCFFWGEGCCIGLVESFCLVDFLFLFCPGVCELHFLDPKKNAFFENNVLPEHVFTKTMWLQDIPLRPQALSVINSASLKWNAK